jgi:uncharacterized protein
MDASVTLGFPVPVSLHAAWNFGQWMMGLNGEPAIWRAVVENGQEQRIAHMRTIRYVAVTGSARLTFWFWHH